MEKQQNRMKRKMSLGIKVDTKDCFRSRHPQAEEPLLLLRAHQQPRLHGAVRRPAGAHAELHRVGIGLGLVAEVLRAAPRRQRTAYDGANCFFFYDEGTKRTRRGREMGGEEKRSLLIGGIGSQNASDGEKRREKCSRKKMFENV